MKSYITEEECQPTKTQAEVIETLLKLTGGRQSDWHSSAVQRIVFAALGDCHVRADIYEHTINLDINWVDYDTAIEIVSLLVNRRDT